MDNKKLDLISMIDSDIIDRATEMRRNLSSTKRKKSFNKRSIVVLIAATLLLSLFVGTFAVLMFARKEVPVYTGMTVSTSLPVTSAKTDNILESFLLSIERGFNGILTLDSSNKAPNLDGNNGNHKGQIKDAVDEELEKPIYETEASTDVDSSLTLGDNSELYYAGANEDIYITIHFDNPDSFEILSFTFNGQKYTSYMFEEGSNVENIIIKVNTGDTAGLIEYTIDAIKYVDGTEIKDVKMKGDQTIGVGVYSEALQPSPGISDEIISYNDISFKVDITDSLGLVEKSQGKLFAMLYDGEEIIASEELTVGETASVRFEKLATGRGYQYAIVGVYDSYDKQGVTSHILLSKKFTTKSIVAFENVVTERESVSFSLVWDQAFEGERVFTSFVLYKGEEKLRELPPDATGIDGLLSDSEYRLVAEYVNNGVTESIEYTFKTKAKAEPVITVESVDVAELTALKFNISITDSDNIAIIKSVELLRDGEVHKTLDSVEETVVFENLEPLHIYTLKIACSYDPNDGNGERTVSVLSEEVNLQSKGLFIEDGEIRGIGTCMDTELYINMRIGVGAFSENASIEIVHLGNGVTEISPGAFNGCAGLTKINIPEGVTSIGRLAFYECVGLTEINIPSGVTTIDEQAFCNCTGLTEINIPDSVTSIGADAFCGCNNLEIANIPSGIKEIPPRMFAGCNLQGIVIPQGVTSIGEGAFAENPFKEIVIPEGVTFIGKYAFQGCYGDTYITTVTLPKSLVTIEERAFLDVRMEELIIPEGVTTIKDEAFWSCEDMKLLSLPKTLEYVGERAFEDSGILYGLDVHISELDTWLNNDIYIKGDIKLYLNGEHITEIVIPSNITKLRDYAFYNCTDITRITIHEGVTSIGKYAFYRCQGLTDIIIPSSVTSIGPDTFELCELLESVTILGKVRVIEEHIFQGCQSLKEVYLPADVARVRAGAFVGCPNLKRIYFDGTVEEYQKIILVDGWKDVDIEVVCSDGTLNY